MVVIKEEPISPKATKASTPAAKHTSPQNDTVRTIKGGDRRFSKGESIIVEFDDFSVQPDVTISDPFHMHGLDWCLAVDKSRSELGFHLQCLSANATVKLTLGFHKCTGRYKKTIITYLPCKKEQWHVIDTDSSIGGVMEGLKHDCFVLSLSLKLQVN